MERRWAGSESEKEGGGLSTDAYCPLRLAAVSRGATAGEGEKEGGKCKRKIRICLVETTGKRSHLPQGALTKLRANSAWYMEWKQQVFCGVVDHSSHTTNPSLLMVAAIP